VLNPIEADAIPTFALIKLMLPITLVATPGISSS